MDWSAFNVSWALDFAKLSQLVYLRFEDSLERMEELEAGLAGCRYRLVKTFVELKTDTQAMLVENDDFAVLAFRGTEVNMLDILGDLNATIHDEYRGHSGFFAGYASLQLEIREALKQMGGKKLILTGHSLGGAQAKAALLMEKEWPVAACYTFGSPPVCTKERCGEVSVPVFLTVYQGDVVPRVMVVGGPIAKFALFLLRKLSLCWATRGFENAGIERLFDQLEKLRQDLTRYDHFVGIRWVDQYGKIKELSDAKASFGMAFGIWLKGWRKSFEDHAIAGYVRALEKVVDEEFVPDGGGQGE